MKNDRSDYDKNAYEKPSVLCPISSAYTESGVCGGSKYAWAGYYFWKVYVEHKRSFTISKKKIFYIVA
jgi:hypothetical protein